MHVGENVVDGLGADQIQELGAVAIDAERVRKGKGGGALMLVGVMRRQHEGLLGLHRIPQEAFHIGNRGPTDLVRTDVLLGQLMAGTKVGVHGPLAIFRQENHGAGGQCAVLQPRGRVVDADVVEVVLEDVAQKVVGHLADEGRPAAERGHAGCGIGCAAARDLLPRQRHLGIEFFRPIGVDQVHDSLGHAFALDEAGLYGRDDIDNGIADGQHVEAGLGHGGSVCAGTALASAMNMVPAAGFEPATP